MDIARDDLAVEIQALAKKDLALARNWEASPCQKRFLENLIESQRTRALRTSKALSAVYVEVMQNVYEKRMLR